MLSSYANKPLSGPALPLLELRQHLRRADDLALLALDLGVLALVVAAKQEHNLSP